MVTEKRKKKKKRRNRKREYILFRRQIAAGGPVTVTDRRIIHYFMTIPEASRLALTSGAGFKMALHIAVPAFKDPGEVNLHAVAVLAARSRVKT